MLVLCYVSGGWRYRWLHHKRLSIFIKNPNDAAVSKPALEIGGELKAGEYHPIFIKIDKNEMGGYTSFVYNRHGTHLTKENRQHFVNILHHMIVNENELRSHKFKLLTFKKDK